MAGLGGRVLRNRSLVRAPVPLFRAGLGFLLGKRLVMVEHVGRRSGLARYVVLEVLDAPSPNTLLIASGFGERAQWFRNLRATPACHVWHGTIRRRPATAQVLPAPDRDEALADYRRDHPKAWEVLSRVVTEAGVDQGRIPIVRLTLHPRAGDGAGDKVP